MHTSSTLEVIGQDATPVDAHDEDSARQPNRAPRWWRFGKLGLALAFLASFTGFVSLAYAAIVPLAR
jgi:hypothetical protein